MKKYLLYILISISLINFCIPTPAKAADGYCVDSRGEFVINGRTSNDECNKKGGIYFISTPPICNWLVEKLSIGGCVALDKASASASAKNLNYTLLAPLPCKEGTQGCVSTPNGNQLKTFNPAQPNNLGVYLNIMIRIFIGLCAVLSVVMIVIGGIEYMTSELAHTKEAGKSRITNAILGLIIALSAYALLYTINPDLLKTDITSISTKPATK